MDATELHVLHVDDDPSILELSGSLLGAEDGLAVTTETDPAAAVERFDPTTFDCVVSDYDMPAMDGLDLYRELRGQFEHPEFPFILFTGKGSEEVAAEALNAGVTGYLQKGGAEQYERLANRLRNTAARHRSTRKAERYETVLEALGYPVYVLDAEGRFRFVDDAFVDLFGYDREAVLGEPSSFLKPPETVERAEEQLGRILSGDGPDVTRFQATVETADGTRLRCRDHMGVLPYEGDSFRGSVGILRPVAVEEGEPAPDAVDRDHLTDLVVGATAGNGGDPAGGPPADAVAGGSGSADATDRGDRPTSPDGGVDPGGGASTDPFGGGFAGRFGDPVALVEYVDGDPVVRRVNAAFEETFGHPPARTVGASLNDLVVPDDDGTADDADARARAGEAVRRVVERETAAGDRREFLLRTAPADANGAGTLPARPPDDAADPGERGPLVYATYVDVAGAVPTRPTLDRYKPLAETLDDPVYLLDAEGRFQYVNRSFLDLVGYDRGEVLGAAPSLVKDDAAVERAEAELGRLLSDDGPDDVQFEVAIRPRTGDPIPCEDHMGVLPYDGERFRGSVGILRDIRDRKERERALRRRNERLDEFARVVSHDLRNPLSVARGRLDVARREVGDDADAHLESVDEAHGRMEELVEDLLELARGSGAVEDPDPVDLGATAGRCWDTVATATATLAVETDATVLAEESRLRQLLENLMRNAVEHGSTGSQNAERSGDVAERSSAGSRTESDDAVEHAGDDVTVEVGDLADGFYVADDGPGIPPDEHEAVFEPGHSTTDDGTGFGLAIAERVAEGHDWSLVATAADDGGARFEVRGVEFAD